MNRYSTNIPSSNTYKIEYVGVKTPLYVNKTDLENDVVKAFVFNTDC